ncbi:hypothetical protein C8R44DRAFT_625386, partial [Mycena epipterygia]
TEAVEFLGSPGLFGVFVTDPRISGGKHYKALAKIVAYVKAGGSVVLGGMFSSFIAPPELATVFRSRLGPPLLENGYYRTTFSLNRQNTLATSSSALSDSYSMKVVHLSGVPADTALYLPSEDSHLESMVFAPSRMKTLTKAPVIFAEVGKGRLGDVGDVGDVNSEMGSTNAMAMLGLAKSS